MTESVRCGVDGEEAELTDDEKTLKPLDLDLCERCYRLGYESSSINEQEDLMWACVGEIIKPENPKDLHEKFNEIRLCILRDEETDDIVSFEWTPYETSRMAMALTWAVSNYLVKEQPTLSDLEKLKESERVDEEGVSK